MTTEEKVQCKECGAMMDVSEYLEGDIVICVMCGRRMTIGE